MAARTKEALAEALITLSQKKSLEKITIRELSDACGISRQSFYYHFEDILDLLEWTMEQAIEEAVRRSLAEEDPVAALEHFVALATENSDRFRRLSSSRYHTEIQAMVVEGIKTYLNELLRHRHPELDIPPQNQEAAILFYACGIAGILLASARDRYTDSRVLAEQLYAIIAQGIK